VCHQTVSLVAEKLEANGIATVVLGAARDIVEQVGVPRFVHSDFPLGSPCGEPHNKAQQREILEIGFKLLERAFVPRTTVQTPYKWSKGDAWKSLVYTPEQPFQTPEREKKTQEKKARFKKLVAEGKL
jgi:D-proline reductase (dithiol) PrdB